MDAQDPATNTAIQMLANINQLVIKAFKSKSQQHLIFTILNDTAQVVKYDRAVLWHFSGRRQRLLGVSGQAAIAHTSALARQWYNLVKDLKDPRKPQPLSAGGFRREKALWNAIRKEQQGTSVLWLPIVEDGQLVLGLWLERWNKGKWQQQEQEAITFILHGYQAAWERYRTRIPFRRLLSGRLRYILAALLIALFVIKVPLRVVSPCEVVPKDPILVTAPLNGIVAEIIVRPGQTVAEGELLFEYDKRVPLQDLKIAQKQVEIIESEVYRTMTLGLRDRRSLAELAVLQLRLQKEKLNLELAEHHASKLEVTAPYNGIVMLENPEEWRGKPVQVGERVLIISDPNNTKIRIWVPVDDNVVLDPSKPVKVILNISPESTYRASLTYLANFSGIGDKQIPAFQAEAEWLDDPGTIKMGLKGTAILFGDDVSLAYYLFRKPWAYFRDLLGM